MLKTRRLKNTWKLGVTRVFMIIMEKKEWEWETMRGSGGNQSEMSPHALWPVEWLLFSPGLFNKNWKNRVLYLIAVDLINVAITFAARIPFLFFFFLFYPRTLAEVVILFEPLYFFIFLHRFNQPFDSLWCNESQSRYRSAISSSRLCVPRFVSTWRRWIWKIS